MGQHTQTFCELIPNLFIIEARKHSFLEASSFEILRRYLVICLKLLEILSVATRLHLLSQHSPLFEALAELEPGQFDLDQLDVAREFLQCGGDDSLIFNGVERAGRVGDSPADFKQLEALEQDSLLEHVQGCSVLRCPFVPFLRDLTDRCVRTARHITNDTIEKDSRV